LRSRLTGLEYSEKDRKVTILNFSHPLTDEHRAQVEDLIGEEVAEIREVPVQIDPNRHLGEQIVEVADRAGLTPVEWQSPDLLVNLPGYAPAAAALLAELHGRMGRFPSILWVQPVEGSISGRYRVAGPINLREIRHSARMRRFDEPPE
jgi:hypothetical protein